MTGRRTIADVVASRRRFVGRVSEIELFATMLAGDDAQVLFVQGPGGIGKSALVLRLMDVAREAGRPVVRVDARDAARSAEGVLESLRRALELPGGEDVLAGLPDGIVLVLDTFELLAEAQEEIRDEVVGRLPAGALVVIAGREPPSVGWRADAWQDLVRVIRLDNLGRVESEAYLAAAGVPPHRIGGLAAASFGHPLGLALLADRAVSGADIEADPRSPDLVDTLVRQFLGSVPLADQRAALELAAIGRVTTEEGVRVGLGLDDASDVFAWLRGLSFMESGPDGLFPHDLARDSIHRDLLWRDPETFKARFTAYRNWCYGRMYSQEGLEQQRAFFDAQQLFRYVKPLDRAWDWTTAGQVRLQPWLPDRADEVRALLGERLGPEHLERILHWIEAQPDFFFLCLDPSDTLRGVVGYVDLARAAPAQVEADPVAAAVLAWVREQRPLEEGESVVLTLVGADRDAIAPPNATWNLGSVSATMVWLQLPRLGWHIDAASFGTFDPEAMTFFGLPRLDVPAVEIDGAEVDLYGHDFGALDVFGWMERFADRVFAETLRPGSVLPSLSSRAPSLSRDDFAQAVRRALRDIERPGGLDNSALLACDLMGPGAGSRADRLRTVLIEAITRLRDSPRDEKHFRALDRTYLRPAATQELAAEVLDLPFSTYRRHLTRGVELVVEDLWRAELRALQRA